MRSCNSSLQNRMAFSFHNVLCSDVSCSNFCGSFLTGIASALGCRDKEASQDFLHVSPALQANQTDYIKSSAQFPNRPRIVIISVRSQNPSPIAVHPSSRARAPLCLNKLALFPIFRSRPWTLVLTHHLPIPIIIRISPSCPCPEALSHSLISTC